MSLESSVHLRSAVEHAARALAELDDSAAGRELAPGKWSPKQVIGHLIDSATINHQRFAQAATCEDLVFAPYDQDAFVGLQAPSDVSWPELLDLWRLLNQHIARLMERMPEAALTRPRVVHNLHQIAFRTVPQEEPSTLGYFMRDYVEHLLYHLRQLGPTQELDHGGRR